MPASVLVPVSGPRRPSMYWMPALSLRDRRAREVVEGDGFGRAPGDERVEMVVQVGADRAGRARRRCPSRAGARRDRCRTAAAAAASRRRRRRRSPRRGSAPSAGRAACDTRRRPRGCPRSGCASHAPAASRRDSCGRARASGRRSPRSSAGPCRSLPGSSRRLPGVAPLKSSLRGMPACTAASTTASMISLREALVGHFQRPTDAVQFVLRRALDPRPCVKNGSTLAQSQPTQPRWRQPS